MMSALLRYLYTALTLITAIALLAVLGGCQNRRATLSENGGGSLSDLDVTVDLRGRVVGSSNYTSGSIIVPTNSQIQITWDIEGSPQSCTLNGDPLNFESSSSQTVTVNGVANQRISFEVQCGLISDTFVAIIETQPVTVNLQGRVQGALNYVNGPILFNSGSRLELTWVVTGSPSLCKLNNDDLVAGATTHTTPPLSGVAHQVFTYTLDCDGVTDEFSAVINPPVPVVSVIVDSIEHDFGSVAQTRSASKTIVVSNAGNVAVTNFIFRTDLDAAVPLPYSIENSTCATLQPSSSCTFDIKFAPRLTDTFEAVITLALRVKYQYNGVVYTGSYTARGEVGWKPIPCPPTEWTTINVSPQNGPKVVCPGRTPAQCQQDWTLSGVQTSTAGPVVALRHIGMRDKIFIRNISGTVNNGSGYISDCRNGHSESVNQRPQIVLVGQFGNSVNLIGPPYATPSGKSAILLRDFEAGIDVVAGSDQFWISYPDTNHFDNVGSCSLQIRVEMGWERTCE